MNNPIEEANELTTIMCVEQVGGLLKAAGLMLQVPAKNPPRLFAGVLDKMGPLAESLLKQADDFEEFGRNMRAMRELRRKAEQ